MTFDQGKMISVEDAADRLGFSPQHVRRLIEAGELEAIQGPGEGDWQVATGAVTAFERRRSAAEQRMDAFSRALDGAGVPPE